MSTTAPTDEAADDAASEKPAGPRSRKGAQTRARLLDAAEQVFADFGFLDARISDIAEQAGLSHGSFYHYFDSKEEIFREVAELVEDRLTAPLWTVVLDQGSHTVPPVRLRQAIRRHMESYREEARIIGVIEQVARYDSELQRARADRAARSGEQVAASIRQLQEHGLADPTLTPEIAAKVLGSMTSRFPELWFVEGRVNATFDEGVEELCRVFINALGLHDSARAPGPSGLRSKGPIVAPTDTSPATTRARRRRKV